MVFTTRVNGDRNRSEINRNKNMDLGAMTCLVNIETNTACVNFDRNAENLEP